jgi:arylsulfatase A-like enzyme
MLISAPGFKTKNRTNALVEFVDIYPTLAELVGLPIPNHCQGTSVVPLMQDAKLPWKPAAFSRWNHGWSIRTDRYRYTEWRKDGEVTDRMLYDHQTDPDENVNIVEKADNAVLVERLSYMLNRGWKSYQ